MDDLINDFICEAREMLQALEVELVAWERDPSDRERLDVIFRFFHTVKGNCGFFDLPRLEALSHAAEDVLTEVRAGNRSPDRTMVDAVLAVIDRTSAMISALEAGEALAPPDTDELALIAMLSGTAPVSDAAEVFAPVAQDSESKPGNSRSVTARTVRLPVELLDRVMNGVSDMILARNEVERHIFDGVGGQDLETSFKRLSGILGDLQGTITQARMQPIGTLFSTYQRLVRDLALTTGKQVVLRIESGEVELDREMIDLIRDPLMHVIRNAIDHGIESPNARLALGKPPLGEIRLSARQTGNVIRIGVMDDGGGIDTGQLVAKAIAAGVIPPEAAENLTLEERAALICEPGLSTAQEVTQLSGRGVGMDAVRSAIERVGGSVSITTTLGAGTRILFNVPLTLSIVPSISVRVAGQTFLIPHSYVDEIVQGGDELESESVGGLRHVVLRGQQRACASLAEVLGVANAAPALEQTLVMLRLINGDVVGLEAARGGEAGRSFAVVAAEVKDLANQTGKATERVAAQIRKIQEDTGLSVTSLRIIAEQINQLEATSVSIAAAVDQQSVARQDLARSIDLAARSTENVSHSVSQVRDASLSTGAAASQVLDSSNELEQQASSLRREVEDFLQHVRKAA